MKRELLHNGSIRSAARVRDLAEVFTAEREVNAMLDLLGPINANVTATYLEPSCGNGNFLVAILGRKLDAIFSVRPQPSQRDLEFRMLQAVASIHGIDICPDNVEEARLRMKVVIVEAYSEKLNTWKPTDGFAAALDRILETNIQRGDMLNGVDQIVVTEFTAPKPHFFGRARFQLADMMRKTGQAFTPPRPIERIKSTPYWRLA